MTTDQALVFAILSATLILFVWGKFRYDLVAQAALLLVSITGLVPVFEQGNIQQRFKGMAVLIRFRPVAEGP